MVDGILVGADGRERCFWAGNDGLYQGYHDQEWGRPVRDDERLFEKICLEGFQSGLSWLTILKKRENFRAAFVHFDFYKVARFNQRSVERLLNDAGIVRHRGKIEATIQNAKAAIKLVEERGNLAEYFWQFVPPNSERPPRISKETLMSLSQTPTSNALSKDLKARGFRFVGPTTCYAFMQAMGLVDDHIEGCWAKAGGKHSTTA
jgi:DNA-3-methyladenine glycosylase I